MCCQTPSTQERPFCTYQSELRTCRRSTCHSCGGPPQFQLVWLGSQIGFRRIVEWLAAGADRGGLWATSVSAEPRAAADGGQLTRNSDGVGSPARCYQIVTP